MRQAETDAPRQPVLDSALLEDISKALSDILQRRESGVSQVNFENVERIQVSGSIVGGNQNIIKDSNFYVNLDSRQEQERAKAEKRQNDYFRAALRKFLAEQERVILFFDHFDDATTPTPISGWLSNLLNLILVETEGYSNLWIIVAGRHTPSGPGRQLAACSGEREIDSLRTM
jgi:hypothetical protein